MQTDYRCYVVCTKGLGFGRRAYGGRACKCGRHGRTNVDSPSPAWGARGRREPIGVNVEVEMIRITTFWQADISRVYN